MRTICSILTAVFLAGCAAPAASTRWPAVADVEPIALAVKEPRLALAAQAGWSADPDAADDVARALAAEPEVSRAGIEALRRRGQAGLDALLATLGAHAARDPAGQALVTRVASQLDAHASGLFWHTDRDAALARARAENKPVLSLRLLGRLDEEMSCANSRFFRTAVYPNAEVAAYLRTHFVLHWSSERPAPHITIDFGDGRKLERTITGNSIHYVLDGQGRVVDALPGLYGARAFVEALGRSRELARLGWAMNDVDFSRTARDWHSQRRTAILARWRDELAVFGLAPSAPMMVRAPSAADAAPTAMPKMAVEGPMVAAVLPSADDLARRTDGAAWRKLAVRALAGARLDGVSRALIRTKRPMEATRDGASPIVDLQRLFLSFEMLAAEDTIKNELTRHMRVHEWLAADSPDFDELNARVYAELFLTPRSDPWLGLLPADTLTGLTNDGIELPD